MTGTFPVVEVDPAGLEVVDHVPDRGVEHARTAVDHAAATFPACLRRASSPLRRAASSPRADTARQGRARRAHLPRERQVLDRPRWQGRSTPLSSPLVLQIGRASCRERVCQYVSISVVAVALKKQKNNTRQKKDIPESIR